MDVSIHEQIGKLMDYGELGSIHPLRMPEIEKADIPDYINCPKYEKAKNNLKQKMERYDGKVSRLDSDIRQMKQNIESLIEDQQSWYRKANAYCDTSHAASVSRQNHAANMANSLLEKIERAEEKHDDLIDRRTEAKEEAMARRQELTLEALLVIDEDIVEVIDRCTEIVGNLVGSQNIDDIVAALELCMIELKIIAMFEDLVEGNAERKEIRAHIPQVNRFLAVLSANAQVASYLVDMYQRNLLLVSKNAQIGQQVVKVLNSVDQDWMNNMVQYANSVLTEKIDTTFEYKGIVDPAQLDAVIGQINNTIAALNQSIVKGNELVAAAGELAKTGVNADQQAKALLSSMESNVNDMERDILSQYHFSVQMLDEAVIDEFFHKDVRSSISALRQHLANAIGEDKLVVWLRDDLDFFSTTNAGNAIEQADLLQLQSELDKVPAHIKKINDLIASAYSDIQEAAKVPQQNSDALFAELSNKYIGVCVPFIGWIFAILINGRVKAYERALRSTNQIYKNLANALLEKNRKITTIVLILGAILGVFGTVVFGLTNGPVALSVIMLISYATTYLLLSSIGKQLRSFLWRRVN